MDLLGYLRTQVHANRLANHRLHHAMRTLSKEEYHAPRTSFFPSLAQTLDHILAVDLYYLAALHGEADMEQQWRLAPKCETVAELAFAQAAADLRFVAHVGALVGAGARRGDRSPSRPGPDPARAARPRHRPSAQPSGASPRPGACDAGRHRRRAAAARRVPDAERGASARGRYEGRRLDRGLALLGGLQRCMMCVKIGFLYTSCAQTL